MPGLIAFNRRWGMASDELVLPFIISFSLRSVWIIVVAATYGIHLSGAIEEMKCQGYTLYNVYYAVYLFVLLFSLLNDILIIIVSSRGTIFQVEKRKHIPKLLYLRLVCVVCEALMGAAGLYLMLENSNNDSTIKKNCFMLYKWLPLAVIIFCFIWVLFAIILLTYSFDSSGKIWFQLEKSRSKMQSYGSTGSVAYLQRLTSKQETDWLKTCRLLFCCLKSEHRRDNVMQYSSKVFASIFSSEKDLVTSDVLAGMILLRQKQKYEESKRIEEMCGPEHCKVSYQNGVKIALRHQVTAHSKAFDFSCKEDVAVFEEITYYAKYALAMYGWPLYCFMHSIPLCTRPGCVLLSHLRCCGSCRKHPDKYPVIADDNCCHCNFASQKAYLNLANRHFIYVSYSDEVFQTPFEVIVDTTKGAIVISIRGTLSLKDVLTDLAIDEEQIPGYNPEWTAHKGFLSAAQAIKEVIERKSLIQEAQLFDTDGGSESYKLVILGHSLGGGTATLLSFLLRPNYPDLICYAYGPSGSALSYEASMYARSFVYSVVLGKDIIARLNLNSLLEAKHNILQVLEKTHLPKWRILRGSMCLSPKREFEEYFPDEEQETNFEPYSSASTKKLYMGGNVVHVCKMKSIYPRCGKKQAEYAAYWSSPEDFQSILISNLMFKDHLPDNLVTALTSIIQKNAEQSIEVVTENQEPGTFLSEEYKENALLKHDFQTAGEI